MGDDEREHCVRTVHAEQNAIYQARKRVPNLKGVTAYINATPCEKCLSELLHYDVKRVVCGSVYRNVEHKEMTAKLITAWGAVIEYQPMPDISLIFGTELEDVKRITIKRS